MNRPETPVGAYDWLNQSIFVGLLHPPERMKRVSMEVFEWT